MKELKSIIKANYNVDLWIDQSNSLHITHKELRIHIEDIDKHFSVYVFGKLEDKQISDSVVCVDETSVIYFLYKYCGDVHMWGDIHLN